jgi:hypothetical protein
MKLVLQIGMVPLAQLHPFIPKPVPDYAHSE